MRLLERTPDFWLWLAISQQLFNRSESSFQHLKLRYIQVDTTHITEIRQGWRFVCCLRAWHVYSAKYGITLQKSNAYTHNNCWLTRTTKATRLRWPSLDLHLKFVSSQFQLSPNKVFFPTTYPRCVISGLGGWSTLRITYSGWSLRMCKCSVWLIIMKTARLRYVKISVTVCKSGSNFTILV